MDVIKKENIYDEHHNKVSVQVPIKTCEQIKEVLEDYGLARLMDENKEEERLNLNETKEYFTGKTVIGFILNC